ncbi:MFS transporter [Alicyclobacillus cycloheptanicus]|uniref:MFS family permease n=1 Tax=Alicyclobacillus cycloheptanicus TaxID=1457 RepID=A0ABT9XGD3_9BACL|nr:MFS transporter [Alicyclobacillus cycloheptanicus]MDQ0189354.1 MFS family permease [Alicyclobacillus cycloheptanicus]WDM01292.1 MFS transporter [Alicyclobacillus cycloheptanicus]
MLLRRYKDKTVLHLQIARTLRSITQGIAVVDLTLYLKDLHWSGAAIGAVMSAAGLVGAALILLVGIMSDRLGRKPFLIVYEILTAIAALLMVFTTQPVILTLIIVLTGFGRGQNGAAGPFTPAEQAWMAARVPQSERGSVFSTNTALGFFGMAIGALVAGTPSLWREQLPGALGFHPLFVLMFLISLACVTVIATAPTGKTVDTASTHTRNPAPPAPALSNKATESTIRRQENRNMAKLAAVNVLNGLAIGFMGPMMSYWFSTKFGVSSSEIGTTLAVSFLLTALSSLITGFLTRRFGMVRSVVWLQLFGIAMVILLPLAPTFWLASAIYVIRSAFSRGTQGARSALSSSLTRDQRRGFSVSMNSLAMRLPSAIGPTLSGTMLDAGIFTVPFLITGALQLCSTLLYGRLFRGFDVHGSDEERPAHPDDQRKEST